LDIWLFRQQSQFKANLSQLKPIQSQFAEKGKIDTKYVFTNDYKKMQLKTKKKAKTNPISKQLKSGKWSKNIFSFGMKNRVIVLYGRLMEILKKRR